MLKLTFFKNWRNYMYLLAITETKAQKKSERDRSAMASQAPLLSSHSHRPPSSSVIITKISLCALSLALLFVLSIVVRFKPITSPSAVRPKLRYGFSFSHDSRTGLHSNPTYNLSNEDSPFYQPKSTYPTIFSGEGRSYFPWNSSAQYSLRTAFHFQPESNWMNDPDAPLYYNGWYHLFYQYNPNNAFWGLISWGHAVSVDLIHWLYLDLAMVPDQWYDIRGVWTGSATFLVDGTPVVIYTGSTNESVQVQNVAYPVDPTDFLLRNWTKVAQNPVLAPPPGILTTDFRDPTTAWLGADGLWRLGIGSKVNQTGIALVYKSSDFLTWTQQDHYLHQVEDTGMWECLDFYPVLASGDAAGVDTSTYGDHVKHVLKASMDNTKLDFYAIGTYDYQNHTFTPDDAARDLGLGLRYDYGKFYASKTFYDDNEGRRILWGWINESDSLQDDIEKGWACVQAIPRQVWFDNLTKANLLQWPVDELLDLRRIQVSLDNVTLESSSVVEISGGSGAQWDIELVFENPVSSSYNGPPAEDIQNGCSEAGAAKQGYFGPFGILVLASADLQEQTAVYFYFTSINGTWTALVCSDQSRSTTATDVDKSVYGTFVPVLADETTLSLRVIVDHSIVETFAQGGRACITSRVYPTIALDGEAQLFLFNNGTMPVTVQSLEAWQIAKVYMHAYAEVQIAETLK